MGEKQNQPFEFSFNASLKVDFQGSRVTSDSGLILIRELDERLGLERLIEEQFANQADGPPRAATKSICFTREGPWVYKVAIR